MTEEKAWELLILRLSGEATPGQLSELNDYLEKNPGFSMKAALVEQVWEKKSTVPNLAVDEMYNRHLQRLSNQLAQVEQHNQSMRPRGAIIRLWHRLKVVAVFAILAALVALVYYLSRSKTAEHSNPFAMADGIVSTKNGSKSKLQLPDGTQVWLNSGSTITYGKDFNTALREINLSGEAYFDVVKDSSHPFIIHTGIIDIRVIGTAFNVRSYPEEKNTETSLIRGVVEITYGNDRSKKVVLKPNEKLIVKNDSVELQDNKKHPHKLQEGPVMILTTVHRNKGDSAAVETLWTKNKLAFEDETLEQVAKKIEHWYNIKVTIEGEQLKSTEYSAVFDDESLQEVMYALQLSGNFKYQFKKKELIIYP